jgi:hypothetical protein
VPNVALLAEGYTLYILYQKEICSVERVLETGNNELIVRASLCRSSIIYARPIRPSEDALLLYFFPDIIPLPAAKPTSTDEFRDWPLIPSDPRMLSRSMQCDAISWICKSSTWKEGHGKDMR